MLEDVGLLDERLTELINSTAPINTSNHGTTRNYYNQELYSMVENKEK